MTFSADQLSVAGPRVLSGAGVPSVVGAAAPVGSIYADTSGGYAYRKTGVADTDWVRIGAPAGGISLISSYTHVGANTDNVVFAGLNGDVDGIYYLDFNGVRVSASGATILTVQPNGITTNQQGIRVTGGSSATPPGATSEARFTVGFITSSVDYWNARSWFSARTGRFRQASWTGGYGQFVAPANYQTQFGYSLWRDSVTNITSITVRTVTTTLGATNAISAGTIISLYRLQF